MAAEKKCCVVNCGKTRADNTILHLFPNPKTDSDRFNKWLAAVGVVVSHLDHKHIFKYRRVCHKHFERRFWMASKRLSAIAYPTLFLGESNLEEALQNDTAGTPVSQPDDSDDWFIEGPEIEVTTEEHVESTDPVKPTPPPQPGPQGTPLFETIEVNAATLDQDVMNILGADPSKIIIHRPDLHIELASPLAHISTPGLGKELCKETTDKYPIPSNCVTIGAPMLNLEIKAALPEQAITRDKEQKQLAAAVSCLGNVISKKLYSQNMKTEELQTLVDACNILCNEMK